MNAPPQELLEKLRRFDQDHVLSWWPQLEAHERRHLVEQLQGIDLEELHRLYAQRDAKSAVPDHERIAPLPRSDNDKSRESEQRRLAVEAFTSGQVGYLMVAGGQGTRLGFDHPKGMYPIGPVTDRTLFQIYAEKILAINRRFGVSLPFLIMTSPATDYETRTFFESKRYFGLPAQDVIFFRQGTMPALDAKSGKLLLEEPHRLFLSPNGHGGTLTGLAESGLLDAPSKRGIKTIWYFQVDNPLVDLFDLQFLGQHLEQKAEVSSKVIAKQAATDKLGNLVLVDGKCVIIEYSDLPKHLAEARDEGGELKLWAGNPAIHLFDLDFLRRVTAGSSGMPWHIAKKKVPYMSVGGERITPEVENALKFERFIFDVLPHAERWSVVPTTRAKEFEPVKNASGTESPTTSRQGLSNLAGTWLDRAGITVPRDDAGNVSFPLEISPLFALDADEFARKIPADVRVDGPMAFN